MTMFFYDQIADNTFLIKESANFNSVIIHVNFLLIDI